MTKNAIVAALFLIATASYAKTAIPLEFKTCVEQAEGHTSDQPPDRVVICQKLFPSAPYVRLPLDQRAPDGRATMYGVVELDISQKPKSDVFTIQHARFYDRDLTLYSLVDAAGKPIDETSALMKKNHLPSNRVHFLIYEANGKVMAPAPPDTNKRLQLTGLQPVVLVDGHAIDGRFLGPWEGSVSKRRSENEWFTNPAQPENFAKIRINFAPPLLHHENIGVLGPNPKLPDGTRFKAVGKIENGTQSVRLSTGQCAPALTSYGAHNPLPERVKTSDYEIKMWRFPAMHTLWSKDFHIVFDYPNNLYPSATAMAGEHNFRLKDYIAKSTHAQELVFKLHGNPINQIVFMLKPVQGGGGHCP